MVPEPYELVLLALAAWRTWKLIGDDVILDRPRLWVLRKFGRHGSDRREYWTAFITCPYCAGFWISLLWWGAWLIEPYATLVAAGVWAISAIVGLTGTVWAKLSE